MRWDCGAYNHVVVHHGLEAMRNGDDRHITLQFSPQRLLDDGVGLVVYVPHSAGFAWPYGKITHRLLRSLRPR